ncbi:MAG: S8 family serine peptidase, partial [bacterium]|nr:S8 family serine peptidase [bacterium]
MTNDETSMTNQARNPNDEFVIRSLVIDSSFAIRVSSVFRHVVYLLVIGMISGIPLQAAALTPSDPFYAHQWYLEKIGAPAAWDIAMGNPSAVVAVLDVGVDLDHPDLREAIWINPNEIAGNGVDDDHNGYVDDVHGWDFVSGDNDPTPSFDIMSADPRDLHHGTLVAGIIAARGNNGEGIAGIDWLAKIMPLRVLHSDGSGDVDTVLPALRYAMAEGASVINLSFVGDERSTDFDQLIAEAETAGVLVVAAGG